MILIVVKWAIRPEFSDSWLQTVGPFTEATRAEPGNLWFEWSRSIDDPNEYVLVEAFHEGDAPAAHVNSEHFVRATRELAAYLASTPKIINTTAEGTEWSVLGEMSVGD